MINIHKYFNIINLKKSKIKDERIKNELLKLHQNNYIVNMSVDEIVKYKYMSVCKDNKTYTVELSNEYPFTTNNVMFKINGENFYNNINRISAGTLIVNVLNNMSLKKYNMLVYCHNRQIIQQSDHFAYNDFNLFIKSEYKHLTIDDFCIKTIDIVGTPNFIADGFSSKFILNSLKYNNNEPFYDIIALPDCGGIWYTVQKSDDINDTNKINKIIENIFKIIKKNGFMLLSKFINVNTLSSMINYFSVFPTKYEVIPSNWLTQIVWHHSADNFSGLIIKKLY